MPSLGPLEILVVLVVAMLVFGPDKLPEIARQVGKGLSELRRVQHHLRGELDDAIHSVMDDDKPQVASPDAAPIVPETSPVEIPPPALDPMTPVEAAPAKPEPPAPPLADDAS